LYMGIFSNHNECLTYFYKSIKHKTLEFDYFCFSGLSKIMILNGNDVKKSVEIVNLDSTSTSCDPFDDYPLAVRGTVGTVLDNKTAIVCGGQKPPTKSCYTYGLNAWRPGHRTIKQIRSDFPNVRESRRFLRGARLPML
jgi:hypothetical protein